MNLINALKATKLTRKLDNALIEVKELFNDGQLEYHYYEDENSLKQGEFKAWWNDGTLAVHCYMKDNKKHGEYKQYDYDGKLYIHRLYKNDKIIHNYLR